MAALPAAVLAAGALPAQAETCENAATEAEAAACYDRAHKAADHTLNAAYREIERRLGDDADTRKLLVEAERAWIAFRDAECRFSTSAAEGGTIHPMLVSMCQTDMTTARNAELAGYLACEEGDMACPVPSAP